MTASLIISLQSDYSMKCSAAQQKGDQNRFVETEMSFFPPDCSLRSALTIKSRLRLFFFCCT